MQDRQLSPLDRLLASANNALRTIAAPTGRAARKYPAVGIAETDLTDKEKSHAAGLMRVNHAGEVAAQALYQGLALFLELLLFGFLLFGIRSQVQGAAGDINPFFDKTPPDEGGFEQVEAMGRALAEEVIRVTMSDEN